MRSGTESTTTEHPQLGKEQEGEKALSRGSVLQSCNLPMYACTCMYCRESIGRHGTDAEWRCGSTGNEVLFFLPKSLKILGGGELSEVQ